MNSHLEQHTTLESTNHSAPISPSATLGNGAFPSSVEQHPFSDTGTANLGYQASQNAKNYIMGNDPLDGTTYGELQNSDWYSPSGFVPSVGSTGVQDVFYGAAWGSLLDLMETGT